MKNTLFYIAGYGRSGSTLLDMSISEKLNCISIGAFSNFVPWKNQNSICACGVNLENCTIWNKVIDDLIKKNFPFNVFFKEQIFFDSRKAFFIRPFLSFFYPSRYKKYILWLKVLYNTIFEITGSYAIVESSKTTSDCANRFYNISKALEIDIFYIHLFRDPRGTSNSVLAKPGSPERKFSYNSKLLLLLSSINGWLQSNLYALFPGVNTSKRLFIDYSTFCSNPESTLERIFINSSILPSKWKSTNLRHNLGGNRLRFSEINEIKEDLSWKKSLSWYQLLFINCLLPIYISLKFFSK